MNANFSQYIGVDVSKAWLDIAIENKVIRIKQIPGEIDKFIQDNINEPDKSLVIIESTGGYEILAVDCFDKAGVTVHIAHPNKVRNFARAKGRIAKSDKLDAKILAGYGQFIDPETIRAIPTQDERELTALSSRLAQLKQSHHQECCRVKLAQHKEVIDSHQVLLKLLCEQIKVIEAKMLAIIQSDESLKNRYVLLQTMKGVGPTLALVLVSDLPELGAANKKEIAALVGVAPITKESGQHKGRGITQSGRSSVRRTIYMGALSAVRYDPAMRAFYEKLIGRGKPKKVALVAVMRKMLVILNVMMIKNQPYRVKTATN